MTTILNQLIQLITNDSQSAQLIKDIIRYVAMGCYVMIMIGGFAIICAGITELVDRLKDL